MDEKEREEARREKAAREWMGLFTTLVPRPRLNTGRYWEPGGRPAHGLSESCATGYVWTGEHGDG